MPNKPKPTYIVGLGGSAGGLEAFEQFFKQMPPDTGMAFVVVQHMDPAHKGMLPELLQRTTSMHVQQIEDGMEVEPNNVYVIPSNADVSIFHGTLHLLEPTTPRGIRMPIDIFFRHLAEDQKEKAIAVILSGMGTDGTLGIKAIKENLGFVMVQDPASAKFDGMPQSAIKSGTADYVAAVEEMSTRLINYSKHVRETAIKGEKATTAMQKIFTLIRSQTGQDFSLYKKETIQRRIKRRMDVYLISNIDDYVRYLQENPQEVNLLFKELLIGVTSFFRDPEAYEILKENITAKLLKREDVTALRAWTIGCSTGEEAYSIAITIREAIESLDQRNPIDVQIFATDIDKDAIDVARRGVYDANIATDVSPDRLQKYFLKEDGTYRLKKEIRDMLIFAPHNITMDPPFTKMDIVSCRNLLIYFSPELQKNVVPLLHYSLNPNGILLLGPSESVAGFTDLFATLDSKYKLFQRREAAGTQLAAEAFPTSRPRPAVPAIPRLVQEPIINTSELAQRTLMESFTPPAVLINERGDILYINRRIGKFLEPSPGKANLNIYAMAHEGLRYEIGTAIRKAVSERTEVTQKGLQVKTNGDFITVDLTVKPVATDKNAADLLLVAFQEVQIPRQKRSRKQKETLALDQRTAISELEEELKHTKERLQVTIEEMQASQEDLQSANEELQSANEELQSTNEELTTSKEEMQSLNEELSTVNAELQSKVDLLSHANNDLLNLLNSTEIATIFLDNHLNIRRFTAEATKLINMIDSDVGRPITDLVSELKYDGLAKDVRDVLDSLVYQERQVQANNRRWYLMRILPYRTSENRIEGIVITFVDITTFKEMESSLRDEQALSRAAVATVSEPLLVLDKSLKIVAAGQPFFEAFDMSPGETMGKLIYDLPRGEWDNPKLREFIEKIVSKQEDSRLESLKLDFAGIGRKDIHVRAHRDRSGLIVLVIENGVETVS